MNCGTCKHWNLADQHFAAHGFGKCDARTHEADRKAIQTSDQHVCRIGKFVKADIRTVREREHAQGMLL